MNDHIQKYLGPLLILPQLFDLVVPKYINVVHTHKIVAGIILLTRWTHRQELVGILVIYIDGSNGGNVIDCFNFRLLQMNYYFIERTTPLL